MAVKSNVNINGNKYYRVTKTVGRKSDGTPIKKQFYGLGKNEAEEKANEYINNIKNGFNEEFDKLDINKLVEIWLFDIKLKDTNFKPGSFTKYEGIYRNYIKDSDIGFINVYNCKALNIQKYYNQLSEEGKTESQIKNLNKVLKGAFNYAVQEGFALKNPCSFLSIPKQEIEDFDEINDEEDLEIFDIDSINKIISICYDKINDDTMDEDEKTFYYMIIFDFATGLRKGELLGLQDKNAGIPKIKVRNTLNKVKKFKNKKSIGYEYKLVPPKTKNSIRDIDIPFKIQNLLQNYKKLQVEKYKKKGKTFDKNSLLFTNSNCNIIDGDNLLKKWKKFLEEIKIPYKKWHAIRASYASLLFLSGADIKTVQVLLGHADINTTIQIYIYIFPESKQEAVNTIDKYFH